MRKVTIKRIALVNFKGVRNLVVDFNEGTTTISGRNGTGKTTVFDAFTWLLFGKDSSDRKVFNIKTLDADGKAIPKIPHEVSAILSVDGVEVRLTRRFNEKWQRRRGTGVEEFTGHEEERLFNDVPLSVKEWGEKIASICSENVFKFITNPLYFSSQREDVQRAMLFRMAGDVSDRDIAKGHADFTALLDRLTGKTMDEYRKEIQAKKARIKNDIKGIPERIDERERNMPQPLDWGSIEADIKAKEAQIAVLEGQVSDVYKAYQDKADRRVADTLKLSAVRQQRADRASKVAAAVQGEYLKALSAQRKLQDRERELRFEYNGDEASLNGFKADAEGLKSKRESLADEYKAIRARVFEFDPSGLKCPLCGRPYGADRIEAVKANMKEKFDERNAQDLKACVEAGKSAKEGRERAEAEIERLKARMDEILAEEASLKADPLYSKTLTAPDPGPAVESDAEIKDLDAKIAELEKSVAEPLVKPDVSAFTDAEARLRREIGSGRDRLSVRGVIKDNEERIKVLKDEYKSRSDELARLDKIEDTITKFTRTKVSVIEGRINGLFKIVRFKLFAQQVNGDEVETCEATVDGVPYSDLNSAAKINAGLDIINAICKYEGVSAPIVVDNAESVNELLSTDSQMVRLVVTEDPELTWK